MTESPASSLAAPVVEDTGERMIPEQSDSSTFWEHVHRYRFAGRQVHGKRVLDIACGEGYGSAGLRRAGAASVIGVDVAFEACAHGRNRYGLTTVNGSAESIGFADASFDVVVSFETIEHLTRPAAFVAECRRVLAPGGRLIISTPNLGVFSQVALHNPFHHSELSEEQFLGMLREHFSSVEVYGQHPLRAPWRRLRALAADQFTLSGVRGVKRLQRMVRRCLGVRASERDAAAARVDVVRWIAESSAGPAAFADPFAPYKHWRRSGEEPLFLLAVATLA